ncbi:hypothetical protein E4H12_09600 [Candidatus Thorarchaeota archaeon]|nr:MAG: hypothetical protein E4H12_09600 [Candidatus Thorarchaeota archaeon]
MKYGDELLDLHGRRVFLARIISRMTPAPLINLYVGIIFSFYSPIGLGPILTPLTNILLCIIMMVILPITPILYSATKGKVDLDVSDWESRTKFFLFSLPVYVGAFFVYSLLDCVIMSALTAAYFTVTSGVTLANQKSKVSVHGAGIGGPGTALFFVFGWFAFPVVVVWILVIWSRTVLKQHSLKQSIVGVFLGIIITFCTYPFVYIV